MSYDKTDFPFYDSYITLMHFVNIAKILICRWNKRADSCLIRNIGISFLLRNRYSTNVYAMTKFFLLKKMSSWPHGVSSMIQ